MSTKFDVVDNNGRPANTFALFPYSASMMCAALNALADNSKTGESYSLREVTA